MIKSLNYAIDSNMMNDLFNDMNDSIHKITTNKKLIESSFYRIIETNFPYFFENQLYTKELERLCARFITASIRVQQLQKNFDIKVQGFKDLVSDIKVFRSKNNTPLKLMVSPIGLDNFNTSFKVVAELIKLQDSSVNDFDFCAEFGGVIPDAVFELTLPQVEVKYHPQVIGNEQLAKIPVDEFIDHFQKLHLRRLRIMIETEKNFVNNAKNFAEKIISDKLYFMREEVQSQLDLKRFKNMSIKGFVQQKGDFEESKNLIYELERLYKMKLFKDNL